MCVYYTCTMNNNYKSNILSFEELSSLFTYFYVSSSVSMYVVFECVLQFMCQLHAPTLLCHLCSWHGSLVSVMKRNTPSSSLSVVSLSVSLTIPSSLNTVSLTSTDSAALQASCLQADAHKITNNRPFPGISALETPEMHLLKSNLLDLLLIFFFFQAEPHSVLPFKFKRLNALNPPKLTNPINSSHLIAALSGTPEVF